MQKEVTLETKDFSNFLRCLSALKGICTDVDIRGGVLRQRSTDKAVIIEMDLAPLILDCDISMSNVERKLALLKSLSKQRVQITITDDETYFSGKRSTLRFKNPNRDFMDNKFMSNEEFSNIFTLKEEDLVLEHVVSKDISNFMKVTPSQFNVASFQVRFDGNVASITATTSGKEQHSEIEHGMLLKRPLKGFSNIVTTPFLLDHDRDMLFKIYNVRETMCVDKFTTTIGKIALDVYCRSQLMEEEEYAGPSNKEGGE